MITSACDYLPQRTNTPARSGNSPTPVSGLWALMSERHRAILRSLAQNGSVSVMDIAGQFNISPATARRDTVMLADAGKAVRLRGRLLPAPSFRGEQHFRARAGAQVEAKLRIAHRAAHLLPRQGTVFVDAGSTCLEVGRLLAARPELRIVTNSIPLLALATQAEATIIGIGGEVRRTSLALTGGLQQAWLAALRFDAAVIGAAGLDVPNGAYTSEIHEAAVKAEAIRRAMTRVLVADTTKWNRATAVHFAPWNAFTFFVTDQELTREARFAVAAGNVTVQLPGALVEAA